MRKDYLDVARGVGILLVVLGHSLEITLGDGAGGTRAPGFDPAIFTLWKFIYSFHMPLFFILSGMVLPRLAGTRLGKTASGALYLIVIATLLQFAFAPLRLALPLPGDAPPVSLPDALRIVAWPAVKLEGYALIVIWFLPCLALVRLAVWLIANANRPLAAATIGAIVLLGLAEHQLAVGYFQLRSLAVGAACFAIGQRLGELELDRVSRATCWLGFALALLVTALTFDANHGCSFNLARTCIGPRYGEFAVLMVSGAFGFLPLFALTALAGASSVLAAALLLAASPAGRWLSLIGRRTLELLIVNGITLVFIQPHLARFVTPALPIVTALVLLQCAAGFALHPILAPFLAFCRETAARLVSSSVPATS